jgi:hypothetical protein
MLAPSALSVLLLFILGNIWWRGGAEVRASFKLVLYTLYTSFLFCSKFVVNVVFTVLPGPTTHYCVTCPSH